MNKIDQNNNEQAKKTKIYTIRILVFCAIYLAWFLAASTIMWMGYIQLGYTQLTYLPVIAAAAVAHLGIWGAIIGALGFGFSSWISAFIYGVVKYQHFDLSVVPRVIVVFSVYALYWIFNYKNKARIWKFIIMVLFCVIGNWAITLSFQHIHYQLFGDIKGVLGIKEWIVTHVVTLIAEPLVNGGLALALYPAIKFLKNKMNEERKMIW